MANEAPHETAAPAPAPRQWKSPVLGTEVLDELYEINRTYLGVLALELPQRAGNIRILPPIAALLAQVNAETRESLARCPFSLFSARFHDAAYWQSQVQSAIVREPLQRYLAFHPVHSELAAFTDVALFYAWHLVRSNLAAARILLGMSESTAQAMRTLPLNRIQSLAEEQASLIGLRWADHASFWPSLLDAIRARASDRIEALRLLGIQMIASEVAREEMP